MFVPSMQFLYHTFKLSKYWAVEAAISTFNRKSGGKKPFIDYNFLFLLSSDTIIILWLNIMPVQHRHAYGSTCPNSSIKLAHDSTPQRYFTSYTPNVPTSKQTAVVKVTTNYLLNICITATMYFHQLFKPGNTPTENLFMSYHYGSINFEHLALHSI
jgi:hypothetical protein